MSTDEKWTQVSKGLGNVTEQTRKWAREVCEAAWAAGHDVYFLWGDGSTMDHVLNRPPTRHPVVDFMVHNKAAGQFVRNYNWTNRARFGLRHVIWDQHITSTVVQPGVVRLMADRGDPTANHEDHVHGECFEKTYVGPDGSGGGGSSVTVPDRLDVDGQLGPLTIAKWQTVMGTTVDGVIDAQDSQLIRAVQARLKNTTNHQLQVDGQLGPKTIGALQNYLGSPVDGRISKPRSQVVMALQRRLNENRF